MQKETKSLYCKVRAGFIIQGTSLAMWCQENGIARQYAAKVLKNEKNGPKATELKIKLIQAAEGNYVRS